MKNPTPPPPWVREAIRQRRLIKAAKRGVADDPRIVRVNPNDAASLDAYIEGALARAPKEWHDALRAIIDEKVKP